MAVKAFGAARGFGLSGVGTLTEFVPTIAQLFGSDSYIPIIRDSRQARGGMENTDRTGVR